MGDRNILRDKTLILRIQDEELLSRVRDKITQLETQVGQQLAKQAASKSGAGANSTTRILLGSSYSSTSGGAAAVASTAEGRVMDLNGIHVEPAIQSGRKSGRLSPIPTSNKDSKDGNENDSTLWKFYCDNKVYPARLVNLPCPLEILKTHDRAMYYKTVDVCQLLVVYKDKNALKEADDMLETMKQKSKGEDFPSYYHSGITPPMQRVVEKRFSKREHNLKATPPFEEIRAIEDELIELIKKVSKDAQKKSATTTTNKILEQIEDEVVDYEPWMDDYGRTPQGIEFSVEDAECKKHPEVWLDKEDIKAHEERQEQQKKEQEEQLQKEQAEKEQKEKKRKKKKAPVKAEEPPPIALSSITTSNHSTILDLNDEDDEVTKAAKQIADINDEDLANLDGEGLNFDEEFDGFFDFD